MSNRFLNTKTRMSFVLNTNLSNNIIIDIIIQPIVKIRLIREICVETFYIPRDMVFKNPYNK